MAFVDEIAEGMSKRHTFVRLSPVKLLKTSLTLSSGNLYSMQFVGNPFSVVFSDFTTVTYTEDADILTNLTNNTWYYNRSTTTLYVNTTATIIGNTSNVLQLHHHITVTDSQDVDLTVDPIVGGDLVIWEDRLKLSPKFTSSIVNMLDAVVSTSSSNITLENSDSYLAKWFGIDDTFSDRPVIVWFQVNEVFQKVFTGTVRTLDYNDTTIAIGVVDSTTLFDQPCYMGGTRDEAIYTTSGRTLNIKDIGKISPFVIGSTKNDVGSDDTFVLYDRASADNILPTFNLSNNMEAVCTTYSAVVSGTTNRTWEVCRAFDGVAKIINFGTISSVVSIGGTSSTGKQLTYKGGLKPYLKVTVTSGTSNIQVGDSGVGSDLTFSTHAHYVCVEVVSSTVYYLAHMAGALVIPSSDTTVTSRFTFPTTTPALSILIIQNGNERTVPINTNDYNVSYSTLSNGTRKISVVFVNNFETSGVLSPISPNNTQVYFTYRTDLESQHGTVVEQMLKNTPLTVNAASITAANSALTDGFTNGDCTMVVPSPGAEEHTTIRKALAEVLQSSIGYVRLDETDEVFYELFREATGTSLRTDDDVLAGSVQPRVSYYDMYSVLNIKNKYIRDEDTLFPDVRELSQAKYLHETEKEKNLKTVFDRIPTPMSDRYEQLYGRPRITYSYATDSLDMDTQIGDEVTLQVSNLLGNVVSVDILVTKLIKGINST